MSDLELDTLPDLPQRPLLAALAHDLWNDHAVSALWLGGSLARGAGDAYSDVDLRVALAPPDSVPESVPASARRLTEKIAYNLTRRFAGDAVLHHMLLDDGQIYDLWVQAATRPPGDEARRVLGCRDEWLADQLKGGEDPSVRFEPADPEKIRAVVGTFWISQRKHQRVFYRGLELLAWEGDHRLRQDILRLWYVWETGDDCGALPPMTIHTLTPALRAVQDGRGADALRLLGGPSGTAEGLREAAGWLCDEMAVLGRRLANRLGFEYPAAAEEAAMRGWARFPVA